ncbi:hypothetical protein C8R43DRAFT_1139789 [Mycena crocata]|nr:hypothetical protein C8R43DRAFT_1139789 [Mycena crocata]
MPLLHLDEDILIRIMLTFDISTQFALQVSSHFQVVAHTTHVWLALLSDLGRRILLELPPIEVLSNWSTWQLIEDVKRAIAGPRTWAEDSPQPPTVRHQASLSLDCDVSADADSPFYSSPQLLLGGRHRDRKSGTSRAALENGLAASQAALLHTSDADDEDLQIEVLR